MQPSQGLNVESHQAIRVVLPMRKDHTDRAYCRRGRFPESLSATSKKAAVDKPQDPSKGDQQFESAFLQRGVGCELDFLDHGRRRPAVTRGATRVARGVTRKC